MKFKSAIVTAAVLGCTVVPIAAAFLYNAFTTRDVTIEILARAPERGNFFPREFTLPVGKEAKLRVRNVDTVTHGFAIPALGVDAGEVKAGHIVDLEFTPREVGTYDFLCTVWCSDHHLQMKGTLEVLRE